MDDGSITFRSEAADIQGRRAAGEDVWTAVRDDYLAGLSAPQVCARHGVGQSTLRKRAAHEGWRRADQPWTPPYDEGAELEEKVGGDLDRVGPQDLAWVAHRRMMRAVLRGSASEALRWKRVEQMLKAEQAELDQWLAQDEAMVAHVRSAAAAEKAVSEALEALKAASPLQDQPAQERSPSPAASEAEAEAEAEAANPAPDAASGESGDSGDCFSPAPPAPGLNTEAATAASSSSGAPHAPP